MGIEILERPFFGNTLLAYGLATVFLVVGLLVVWVIQQWGLSLLERWTKKTSARFDNFLVSGLRKVLIPLLYYAVFYFSINTLRLPSSMHKAITALGAVLVTILAVRFILQGIRFVVFNVWLKAQPDAATKERQFKVFMPVVTTLIWALGAIFLLDNLGFKISAIMAGLGIGGVAVALASQTVLADLFSYFAIMFDRPFEIDDFIIVGDFMGSVENIGVKTTRIRSLEGEELIIANKDLTDSRIRNYKRMQLRRVAFKIGITYETPSEKIQKACQTIESLIKAIPETRFDRTHFYAFGEFDLKIETVYFVLSADYNRYMDIQQKINLGIKEAFEQEGIEFAFPTRTVHVQATRADPALV